MEPFEGPAGWISRASPYGAGAGVMLCRPVPQSGARRARQSDNVPPWVLVRLVSGFRRNDEGAGMTRGCRGDGGMKEWKQESRRIVTHYRTVGEEVTMGSGRGSKSHPVANAPDRGRTVTYGSPTVWRSAAGRATFREPRRRP